MILLSPVWLLAALIFCVLYFCLNASQDTDSWSTIIPAHLLTWLRGGSATRDKKILPLLAATIIALALASPALQTDNKIYQHTEGWLVVADISKSMTLEDVAPNRLSSMRDAAIGIAARAGAMPVGLIAYAGDAFLLSPPAFDKQLFNNTIAMIEHGLITTEGSNPTRALSLASSVIQGSGMLHARLFLLTDTGGLNDKTVAAITNLQKLGHSVDLLVFGSGEGAAGVDWNMAAADKISQHRDIQLIRANALGEIDFDSLQLSANSRTGSALKPSSIDVFNWKNMSHWLLLAAIPIFLLMFYREAR